MDASQAKLVKHLLAVMECDTQGNAPGKLREHAAVNCSRFYLICRCGPRIGSSSLCYILCVAVVVACDKAKTMLVVACDKAKTI
jgi:hypothetical protein